MHTASAGTSGVLVAPIVEHGHCCPSAAEPSTCGFPRTAVMPAGLSARCPMSALGRTASVQGRADGVTPLDCLTPSVTSARAAAPRLSASAANSATIASRKVSGTTGFCSSLKPRSLASRKAAEVVSPVMISTGNPPNCWRMRVANSAPCSPLPNRRSVISRSGLPRSRKIFSAPATESVVKDSIPHAASRCPMLLRMSISSSTRQTRTPFNETSVRASGLTSAGLGSWRPPRETRP